MAMRIILLFYLQRMANSGKQLSNCLIDTQENWSPTAIAYGAAHNACVKNVEHNATSFTQKAKSKPPILRLTIGATFHNIMLSSHLPFLVTLEQNILLALH